MIALPPALSWTRSDQVNIGDKVVTGGTSVAVTGIHSTEGSIAGPSTRLALADGTWWQGAPCDQVLIEINP